MRKNSNLSSEQKRCYLSLPNHKDLIFDNNNSGTRCIIMEQIRQISCYSLSIISNSETFVYALTCLSALLSCKCHFTLCLNMPLSGFDSQCRYPFKLTCKTNIIFDIKGTDPETLNLHLSYILLYFLTCNVWLTTFI